MDEFHGQGGSYEIVDGVRRLIKGSTLEHHKDGDGARDEDGKDLVASTPMTEPAIAAPADIDTHQGDEHA